MGKRQIKGRLLQKKSDVSQDKLKEVSVLIQDSQFLTIKDAGHLVHVDQPQAFLDAVQ
jgi:pimeloyl-ACP methyl ester carboxylesterase